MTPEQIKALRKALRCTTKELSATLGVTQKLFMQWEQDQQFPTKRLVTQMERLREQGPDAIVRTRRQKSQAPTTMEALADPELWCIVRKLIAHPAFFSEVKKQADTFSDPD